MIIDYGCQGKGIVTSYTLFDGIQLSFLDFDTDISMPSQKFNPNIISITHCRSGRYECEYANHTVSYLPEGYFSVTGTQHLPVSFSFPLKKYYGLSLVIDKQSLSEEIKKMMETIPLNLDKIGSTLGIENNGYLSSTPPKLHHLFSELYEALKTKKVLWLLVSAKIIQEIIGLHTSIFFTYSNKLELPVKYILLSILFIFVDDLIYIFLVYKVQETKAQVEGSLIRINSYEYYTTLEEEQRKIRKMYHDMKNQIMIYENTEGLKEVFAPMQENLQSMSRFYHTGCPALDMLLFSSRRITQEKGIEFKAVISEGTFSFMAENDISFIFSNAIMNAIEACEKIKTSPKTIQIKAGINQQDVMLYIRNTVSGERSKGRFSTDKSNKKFHGIGLTSIRETAEKYDGYISVIEENQTMQLAIIFAGKGEYEK